MLVGALEVHSHMIKTKKKQRPQLVAAKKVTPIAGFVALTPSERSTLAICYSAEKPGESYEARKIRRECVESLRLGYDHVDVSPIKEDEKIVGHNFKIGQRRPDRSFAVIRTGEPRLHAMSRPLATYVLDLLGRHGHKVNAEPVVLDIEDKLTAFLANSYVAPDVPMAGVDEEYGEE